MSILGDCAGDGAGTDTPLEKLKEEAVWELGLRGEGTSARKK